MKNTNAIDVLYIGALKTASTFFRHFFEYHPQISWDRNAHKYIGTGAISSKRNEFRTDGLRTINISMYEKLCEGTVVHDKNAWLENRFKKNGWEKIKEMIDVEPRKVAEDWLAMCPNSKILFVIRDQVDWLRSAYKYFVANLEPGTRSFQDFCSTPRGIALLRTGHYDLTIETYFDVFGKENVKVLRFERLKTDYEGLMNELCDFLGVEAIAFENIPKNVGRPAGSTNIIKWLPLRKETLDKYLPILPTHFLRLVKRMLGWRFFAGQDVLSKNDQQFIKNFYAVSNLRTEKLLK